MVADDCDAIDEVKSNGNHPRAAARPSLERRGYKKTPTMFGKRKEIEGGDDSYFLPNIFGAFEFRSILLILIFLSIVCYVRDPSTRAARSG